MNANKVKAAMKTGQMAYGAAFSYPSLQDVELVGNLGYDFIWIEGEHGAFSLPDIEEMCIVADGAGLSAVARVPDFEPSTVLGYLDRGVMGIIAPHICTKADAEALVRACYYHPKGLRGVGPGRAYSFASRFEDSSAYMAWMNDHVLSVALVEDEEGIENLPDILTADGLDAVALGPADLAQSMGEPGRPGHARVAAALEKAKARIDASDKPRDRDFMAFTSVRGLLVAAARDGLASMKETKGASVDPVKASLAAAGHSDADFYRGR